jgi:hypothetical protein
MLRVKLRELVSALEVNDLVPKECIPGPQLLELGTVDGPADLLFNS